MKSPLTPMQQALMLAGTVVGGVAFAGVLIVLTDYQNIFKGKR